MPSIFISAGEASGDMYGARLMRALSSQVPGVRCIGIGGDLMQDAGLETLYHVHQMSLVGVSEVVRHLPFINRVLHRLEEMMRADPPDLVVLIDYPGFNLRLARIASRLSIPVLYYVAPQLWAWGAGRIRTLARYVRTVAVILPFEAEMFRKAGLDVEYVGHPLLEDQPPLLDRVTFFRHHGLSETRPLLGLLPGSRSMEIERLLPIMLETWRLMKEVIPALQVAVACAPTVKPEHLDRILPSDQKDVCIVQGYTGEVMEYSRLLLVASGTATLEAALHGTPSIILYKVSRLTWLLAHILVKVPHIGLVNIVAEKTIVPEFLQHQAKPSLVAAEAIDLFQNEDRRAKMQAEMERVRERLGAAGASQRTAAIIARMLEGLSSSLLSQGNKS